MLAVDLIVIALLLAVLGVGWTLHRKLTALRRDRAELEQFAGRFGDAIHRAEQSVGHLKDSTQQLCRETEGAQTLAEDLRFLIERGGTAADRLEQAIGQSRDVGPIRPFHRPAAKSPGSARPAAHTGETAGGDQPAAKRRTPSAAERELLKALKAGS